MRITSLVVLVLVGCAVDEVDTSSTEQEQQACPPFFCSNSDEVGHNGILDVNLRGLTNAQGYKLRSLNNKAQIYKNGLAYELRFSNGRIWGYRSLSSMLRGSALIGAEIMLQRDRSSSFSVVIDNVRTIRYAFGDASESLEAYRMLWRIPGEPVNRKLNLCNAPSWSGEERDPQERLMGLLPEEAVWFAGDRIDPVLKTLSQTADYDWLNLGCAGTSLAKLHLTRNTIISQQSPMEESSWKARQATFKLLTADYCGTGKAFTFSGVPLVWQGGSVERYLQEPRDLEARWNENGAQCLNKARLADDPEANLYFGGDLVQAIHDECATLPVCTNLDPWDFDGAPRMSGNYDLP
jgi:hypothetical protein